MRLKNLIQKKSASILEIVLMIVSTIAFAYIISEPLKEVSAQVSGVGCCEKTKTNAICQNTAVQDCQEGFSDYTTCDETANCKRGCCISDKGTCSMNAPKAKCESDGGRWNENAECKIPECARGCCVLGTQTQFITERECNALSKIYGLQKDFRRQVATEGECLLLAYAADEGACVFETVEGRTCKFGTRQECKATANSEFSPGFLCSHPTLATDCVRQMKTGCIEGRDEVYWFDSCGNRENIFTSNKDESWNKGYVLKKEASCNPGEGNANSPSCGNCDRFRGSTCGLGEDGKAVCKSLDCKNAAGNAGVKKDRKNGESWCVYESRVGNGTDVPGTSHYRHICIDGEIKVERCQEARVELCAETEIQGISGKFSQAGCIPNLAYNCLQFNTQYRKGEITKEEFVEKCNENPHCMIIDFEEGKYAVNPQFKFCTSRYPRGFTDLKDDLGICGMASWDCTRIESIAEFLGGRGKCGEGYTGTMGCDCGNNDKFVKAGQICKSLGDCGASVNVEGTESLLGFRKVYQKEELSLNLFGSPDRDWKADVISYLSSLPKQFPVAGQKIEPGDFAGMLEAVSDVSLTKQPSPGQETEAEPLFATTDMLEWTLGIGGVSLLAGAALVPGAISGAAFTTFVTGGGGGATSWFTRWLFGGAAAPTGLSSFFYVLFTTMVGAAIGYLIGTIFGLHGDALDVLTTMGAVAGLVYGIAAWGANPTWLAAFGWIAFAIIVIVAIVLKLTGVGEVQREVSKFQCSVWQPPYGGKDCEKCNKNPETCTAYKCKSLGMGCKYVEEGGEGKCLWVNSNDVNAPAITPWERLIINSGLKIDEKTENGIKVSRNGECLQQYANVSIGINTDEETRCKYDLMHKENYEGMAYEFLDGWGLNHSLLTSFSDKETGEINVYIRCADANGNFNPNEYVIKTCVSENDLTPPMILFTNPQTNTFLGFGKNSTNITIAVNEPGECRWSSIDQDYNAMANNFDCSVVYFGQSIFYWPCMAEIRGLMQDENHIFIRCLDKPNTNLTEERNANRESYEMIFRKSTQKLNVSILSPHGDIMLGKLVDLVLKAETSGGADGNAVCSYSFTGYTIMANFFTTSGKEHTQKFSFIQDGSHSLFIECRDTAGNTGRAETNFSVRRDRMPPESIRVYHKEGNLYIETDENATCTYSFESCGFELDEGIGMKGTEQKHETAWKPGKTYYIKCKDVWNNIPDGCSITIKAV
jgi:hypothetical protein